MKRFLVVAMCVFCCVFIFSPVVVLSAPAWQTKFRDNDPVVIGTDADISIAYDETTDDRLEIGDGTNLFLWLKDLGTTGSFGIADNSVAAIGSDSDFQITYDETTDDRLEVSDGTNLFLWLKDLGTTGSFGIAGSVGIGTDAPIAKLDIVGANYNQLNLARYKTTGIQRTAITAQHYDATEEPVCLFLGYGDETNTSMYFGGGSVLMNAATSIGFFTAANNTSTTGANRMAIGPDGNVTMYYDLDLRGGDLSNSTGTTVTIPEDVWTGVYEATDHSINLRSGAANDSYLNFYEADANNGGVVWYDGGDEALYIGTRNASATPTAAIKIPDGTTNVTILGGVTTTGSWDNNGENVYLGVHGASFEGLRINVVNGTGESFLMPEDDDDGLVFGIKPATANNGDAEIAFFPTGTAINGSGLGKFIVYDPGTTTETFKVMADTGITSLGGKIDKYNNVATEGYGVGAIVDNVELTGQIGTVASADCSNAGTAGQYRVDYYLVVTTTEAGDSVAANITWNDGTAARTVTSSSVATDATNYTQGSVYCRLGSGSVAYSTTYTGTRTTAIYSLYLTCTRLN